MIDDVKAVQVPGSTTDPARHDLLGPLESLLQGINVLGDLKDASGGAFSAPDQATAVEFDGVRDYVAHAITTTNEGDVEAVLVQRPGGQLRWVDGRLVTAL